MTIADKQAAEPEFLLEHTYVAVKDFSARIRGQLLNFTKDSAISHDPGAYLAAKGAPIRILEDS
jgi:hypothetical protein